MARRKSLGCDLIGVKERRGIRCAAWLGGRYGVTPLPPALSSHSSRHFVSTVPKEVPGGHSLRVSAAHTRSLWCQTYGTTLHGSNTHGVGDLGTAGHPPDPQTIEGQDHEETRFWRRGVGCIRYTTPFQTFAGIATCDGCDVYTILQSLFLITTSKASKTKAKN